MSVTQNNDQAKLRFSNRPPIVKLQAKFRGEEIRMRIEGNQGALALLEGGQTSSQGLGTGDTRSSASASLGEDQAELSGIHVQVPALAAQVSQFPEVRQEKVNALRQAVESGSFQPSSSQVAGALFDHLLGSAGT
jgi:flagellar biosynthesis anti-sigma factor FlgM